MPSVRTALWRAYSLFHLRRVDRVYFDEVRRASQVHCAGRQGCAAHGGDVFETGREVGVGSVHEERERHGGDRHKDRQDAQVELRADGVGAFVGQLSGGEGRAT